MEPGAAPDPKKISFCALPYIDSTKGAFSIAEFDVWPNNSSNWISYLGVDFTDFMTQYRNKNDQPVEEKASIITHKDRTKLVDREEFRRVIVCLSTAAWILDEKYATDAWLFEAWHINPNQDQEIIYYQREAKYTLQFNSHEHDRLHPGPYMSAPLSCSFSGFLEGSEGHRVLSFLEHQLTCDPQKSLIGVLHRFHKVRFDIPYYTSMGDDLDSLWSGFELLWNISKAETVTSDLPLSGLHKFLSKLAQNRLIRAVLAIGKLRKNRRKSQLLADFILSEFEEELQSRLIDRNYFESGLRVWTEALYNKRNKQSHGDPLPVKDEILPYYNRSIYFTGIIIARGILFLRIHRGAYSEDRLESAFLYLNYRDSDPLPLLFSEHPVIAEIVKFINGVETTDDWFVSKGNGESKEKYDFEKFAETLTVFAGVEKTTRGYKGDRRLLNASKKLALVLSKYSKLSKDKNIITDRGVDLSAIADLITNITLKQKLAGTPQDDRARFALLEEVVEFCDKHLLHRNYVYKIQKTPNEDLMIRPGIEIWLWIAALNRMVKIYRGY